MFRSTTIIRELVLNLAEVIFMLKNSVKLRRYMLFGDVAACHRAVCVFCAVQSTAQNTHGRRPKHVGLLFMYILI